MIIKGENLAFWNGHIFHVEYDFEEFLNSFDVFTAEAEYVIIKLFFDTFVLDDFDLSDVQVAIIF